MEKKVGFRDLLANNIKNTKYSPRPKKKVFNKEIFLLHIKMTSHQNPLVIFFKIL